jgi:hypothetical protein
MRFITKGLAALMFVTALASTQPQEKTVMVGGAAMYPSKDIVDNAVNSKDASEQRRHPRHQRGGAAGLIPAFVPEETLP